MPNDIFVTGFGFTGARLAARLVASGDRVSVIVRRESQAHEAQAKGAAAMVADFDNTQSLSSLDLTERTLVHLAPPPRDGDRDTRLRNLLDAVRDRTPDLIVLISTTGVYGDHGGALVTEQTPVNPQSARAVRRVDAELAATEFCQATGARLIVLRVPGIYGPGRLPLAKLREGAPLPPVEDCGVSNRIHVEDLVTAIVACANSDLKQAVFNVSDGHSLNMRLWREKVADVAGLPRPPEISLAQAQRTLSPMTMSFLRESRRIDSSAIRSALDIKFQFEDIEAGIRHSLEGDQT